MLKIERSDIGGQKSAAHAVWLFVLLSVLYPLTSSALAQTNIILQDDFEDGDLSGWTEGAMGHWANSTNSPITGARSLKHNLSGVGGTSYLYAQPAYTVTTHQTTWRLNLKNSGWDPTSQNLFYVFLMANDTDLAGATVDGYAVGVQFPTTGTPDPVQLSRVFNGVATAIITSATDWATSQTMGIEVTRSVNGEWTMRVDTNGGFDSLVSAGTVTDTNFTSTTVFGLAFVFTSSRAGLLWMDDVRIEQAAPAGDTPPFVAVPGPQSVQVNHLLQFGVTASDSDGDFITLTASNVPANAVFTPSNGFGAAAGALSFTPATSQVGQVYTVYFQAADKDGTNEASTSITVKQAFGVAPIWINEINYDPPGGDSGEFIEIAGPAGFNLSGFSLVLYNGGNGQSYGTTPLSGIISNQGCNMGARTFLISGIQNGAPDGVALVQGGTSVIEFLSYEGTFTASNGLAQGYESVDPGVAQADEWLSIQHNGVEVPPAGYEDVWAKNMLTPGTMNPGQFAALCGEEVVPANRFVSPSGGNVYPYTNWTEAAPTLQLAVDAAVAGDTVWVTNGVYDVGGAVTPEGNLPCRVVVTKDITVRSVNGSAATAIKGLGPRGDGAIRCVYLSAGTLDGFTITNGMTHISGGTLNENGGGLYQIGGVVSNCIFTGNEARYGGGASGSGDGFYIVAGSKDAAILNHCLFKGNRAVIGGGANHATLNNCLLAGNWVTSYGGGAAFSRLISCVLSVNTSVNFSAAAYWGELDNCTVVGNTSGAFGYGVEECTLINCIVYSNAGAGNFSAPASFGGFIAHTCTTPLPAGDGNLTNDPQFVDAPSGDFRLEASSPCVDAGINLPILFDATDLGGNTRVINNLVDIGAYELVFEADVKALLQGPYDTNTHCMAGVLTPPAHAPYAADARAASAVPSNATDWVAIELRGETNGAPLYTRSAWISEIGILVSDTGAPPVLLETGTGTYYMVIRHRNHLTTMTAAPVSFTNRQVSYDFTASAEQNVGGTNAVVEVEPGIWALIAGDADGDGAVLPVDTNIWQTQFENP